ncbi:Transcriptional regulator STP3 [Spathaspora sp. JA1]|nr:Transcriptional regulator STP3 [Spathaspora sp. JA1]
MSLVFTVGLKTGDTTPTSFHRFPSFTSTELLTMKIGIFKFLNRLVYGTQRYLELFPPLHKSTITNINNSKFQKFFPVNCAADDLDLGFGNSDQIEFFNHMVNDNTAKPNVFHYDFPAQFPSNQLPMFDDFYEAHNYTNYVEKPNHQEFQSGRTNPLSQTLAHPQLSYPQYGDFGMVQPHTVHRADKPYFDDFAPTRTTTQTRSSVSSEDGSISPLSDDLFHKYERPQESEQTSSDDESSLYSRKRRIETSSPSSESDVSSHKKKHTKKANKIHKHEKAVKKIVIYNEDDEPTVVTTTTTTTNNTVVRKKTYASKDGSIDNTFECPHCDATFKVKGYLTRHLKKHNSTKAFVCPFYQEPTSGSSGTRCHPTGGFSRRDTFKTHLKALHFIYPPGTKSNERNNYSGRCAGCFQHFENNSLWLENHIESNKCKGTVQCKESETEVNSYYKSEYDQELHASHYIKHDILD